MALKFTDAEVRWLRSEGVKTSHIKAWEAGTCPAHRYLPLVVKVTGKDYPEIFDLYSKKPSRKKGGSSESMSSIG